MARGLGIDGADQWRTHGASERITRTLDVSHISSAASPVSNLAMVMATYPDGVDVTPAVTSGAMAIVGQVITLLRVQTLTKGTDYCVAVRYTKDGNNLETRFYLDCPSE